MIKEMTMPSLFQKQQIIAHTMYAGREWLGTIGYRTLKVMIRKVSLPQ